MKKDKPQKIINPTTMLGKELPLTLNDEDKKIRKSYYIKESLIFALGMIIIDIILLFMNVDISIVEFTESYQVNLILYFIIEGILMFGISFVCEYLLGEQTIKAHNKLENKNKSKKK